MKVNLEVPNDDGLRVEVAIWGQSLAVERFLEIAKSKGARVGSNVRMLAPKVGPILDATWIEDGVKVVLHGPVDEDRCPRTVAA